MRASTVSPRRASDCGGEGEEIPSLLLPLPLLLCDSAAAAAGASESLRAARSFADATVNLSWPTSSSQRTQKNDASIARAVEAVASRVPSRAAARQEEEEEEEQGSSDK